MDLGNQAQKTNWYYSFEGKTYGPYELSVLLEKIGPDSLVWKEGIEWTKANEVPELRKFFKEEPASDTQPVIVETKKSGNKFLGLVIAVIVVSVAVFFGLKFIKPPVVPLTGNILDTPIVAKVYANIKKDGVINIGYLPLASSDDHFNTNDPIFSCLKEVFGDRIVKLKECNDKEELISKAKAEEIHLVLMTKANSEEFTKCFDISDPFSLQGKSESYVLAMPMENKNHLDNLNDCLSK
jgi:hypothetical protein